MRVVFRVMSALLLAGAGLVLAAWVWGLLISDRVTLLQALSWIPGVVMAPAAAALWLGAMVCAKVGRAGWGRRARWGVGACVVAAAVHVCVVELRLYRLPLGARPAGAHLRVLHWNVTSIETLEPIASAVLAQRADVVLLVNPNSHAEWGRLPEVLGPEYRVLTVGGFVIASRVPVIGFGMTSLGLVELTTEVKKVLPEKMHWVDPGRAMFVRVDAGEVLGGPLAVWVVDMPSEPRLSRWTMTGKAAESIHEWSGTEMGMERVRGERAVKDEGKGFPVPDVVVGDFNIPRGAASLSRLVPGMRSAYDEAGAGFAATWPRAGFKTPWPVVHIDQMFTGRGVRAARYEIVDPGCGIHMMQVGDVERASR